MALKVGDVYVVFTVDVGPFLRRLRQLVKTIERTAAQVEAIGNKMGEFGMRAAAGIAAAIYAAGKVDPAMAASVERFKTLMLTLASDIGKAFAPTLERVNQLLSQLVGWFQRLSPEAKATAARFAAISTAVLLAGGVVGKFAGLVSAAFKALGMAIDGLRAVIRVGLIQPILIGVAVAAALFVIAGVIREAWDENLLGIRDTAAAVWQWLGDSLGALWKGFKGFASSVFDIFWTVFKYLKDQFFNTIDTILGAFERLAERLHQTGVATLVSGLRLGLKGLSDDMSKPGEMLGRSFDFALAGFNFAANGMKKNLGDLKRLAGDAMKSLFGSFSGGDPQLATLLGKPEKDGKPTKNPFAGVRAKDYGDSPAFATQELTGGRFAALGRAGMKHLAEIVDAEAAAERTVIDALNAAAISIAQATLAAAKRFVSRLGDLGETVNAALQGLESGGPFGALAMVLEDLFSRFAGFKDLIALGTGIVGDAVSTLGDAFGSLVQSIRPLLGAASYLIDVVLRMLSPVLVMIGKVLEPLAPLLYLVGFLLQGLQPLFDLLAKVLEGVAWLLDKVIRGVFEGLRGVGIAVLEIIKGLAEAWNGIVSAVQWVLRTLADIDILGAKPLAFLSTWADGIEHAKAGTDGVSDALAKLKKLTFASATALSDENAERVTATASLKEMSNALTSMPSGYKLALRRFQAMAGEHTGSLPHLASGGIAVRPTVALIGEAGPEAVIPLSRGRKGLGGDTYIFNVRGSDPRAIAAEVERRLERRSFQRHGTLARVGPPLLGGL